MKDKKNIIFEAIVTALFSVLVSTLIFTVTEIFTSEKIGVFISDSNKVNDEYITIINIKNYQDSNNIEKLELYVEGTVIEVFSELQFKNYGNKVIIENIYPNYNSSIILFTNEKIDNSKLNIYCSSKSNIEWINENRNIIDNIKDNVIIYFITVFIMTLASNLYMKNMYNKSEKLKDEEIKLINKEMRFNDERIIKNEEKIIKIENQAKEYEKEKRTMRRYLISIINDYSKELSFWKDTIRKAFCKNKKDLKNMDDFFEFVTMNLKTYKTLKKCDYSNIDFILSEKEIDE